MDSSSFATPVVLVTGGAGFLGINLIRFLLQRGCRVRSLDIAPFTYPERSHIEVIDGDIRNPQTVDQAMAGVNVVVHCAAALPLYAPVDIFSTDVEGTRCLFTAATQKGVDRFVYISSTAVYGVPDHHPLYETDSLHGVGPYGQAKVAAEKIAEEFRHQGLCVPIIRPKSFIGPERLGVFALLFDWASDGHGFPLLGNGKNRYQLLDVADLCAAIWLTITKDRLVVNDTFNIGATQFATMRQDYQAVLNHAGYGKKIRCLPAGPAIAILKVLEKLRLSPLYAWVYETASHDSFVATDKAEKLLGWQPQYSNQAALIRNYDWYVSHRQEFSGQTGVSHRLPWQQGILSFAKHFF